MPDLYNMYPTVTWETVKTLEVRSLVYSNLKSWAERWQGGKAERKAFLGIFEAKQGHYEVPFRAEEAEEAEKAERRAPFGVFGTKRIGGGRSKLQPRQSDRLLYEVPSVGERSRTIRGFRGKSLLLLLKIPSLPGVNEFFPGESIKYLLRPDLAFIIILLVLLLEIQLGVLRAIRRQIIS